MALLPKNDLQIIVAPPSQLKIKKESNLSVSSLSIEAEKSLSLESDEI